MFEAGSDSESPSDEGDETDEPIGGASLFRTEHDRGEIGYWLVPEARGEGFAAEAVSLSLDHAFDTSGRHRLYARVVDSNEPSRALVERLGFAEEGRLREHAFVDGAYRDVVYYDLLREEWEGRARPRSPCLRFARRRRHLKALLRGDEQPKGTTCARLMMLLAAQDYSGRGA